MSADIGHGESPGVRTGVILIAVVVILATLILVAFGFTFLFHDRIGKTYSVRSSFPPPGVLTSERAERVGLEHRQLRALNGAGGRMPIDAAMKAIATKGAHGFDPVGGTP